MGNGTRASWQNIIKVYQLPLCSNLTTIHQVFYYLTFITLKMYKSHTYTFNMAIENAPCCRDLADYGDRYLGWVERVRILFEQA